MSTNTQDTHQQLIANHANTFTGSMAESYNARTGGGNIQLATHLISLSLPHLPQNPPPSPLRILDNACGPLVVTTELLKNPTIMRCKKVHISAVDLSPDFVKDNAAVIAANAGAMSNGNVMVDTEVMDGMDLKFPDETFDLSFTSLAIFTFPDPVKGASELYRTLKPGGIATLTTPTHVGWTEMFHEVERRIKPIGSQPTRFPMVEAWMLPGKLEGCLRDGGFKEVKEGDVEAMAWFDSIEAMAGSVAQTLKIIVGDAWTGGEKERMEEGFLSVLKEKKAEGTAKGFNFEEGGRAGMENVADSVVARK